MRSWRLILLSGAALVALAGCLALLIGYWSGYLFFSGITPCWPPPGWAVDGAARARAVVWEDRNADGIRHPDEPPVQGIMIGLVSGCEMHYVDLDYGWCALTDNNGRAEVSDFRARCACKCWEGATVYLNVPPGYRATTPTKYELTADSLTYSFGLVRLSTELE